MHRLGVGIWAAICLFSIQPALSQKLILVDLSSTHGLGKISSSTFPNAIETGSSELAASWGMEMSKSLGDAHYLRTGYSRTRDSHRVANLEMLDAGWGNAFFPAKDVKLYQEWGCMGYWADSKVNGAKTDYLGAYGELGSVYSMDRGWISSHYRYAYADRPFVDYGVSIGTNIPLLGGSISMGWGKRHWYD